MKLAQLFFTNFITPLMRPMLRIALALSSFALLNACAGETPIPEIPSLVGESLPLQDSSQPSLEDLTRYDSQGAVEFVVLPLNLLSETHDTLEFQISMNTHSVELSMDLAMQSILQTHKGEEISALSWSGGSGHHVKGVLVFPSISSAGTRILSETSNLILTIRDVDAPERIFEWDFTDSQ